MNEEQLKELVEKLAYAKNAVISCLNDDGVLVDMHGLSYWASEVEALRIKIKKLI